jgi:nucleotide-binding universal stress UspA family protein
MSPPRVLVGIDGSVSSFDALDVAAAEARLRTAGLEVVTCADDPDETGPVLRAAAARVARRHPGTPVTTVSAVGDPADVLAERGGGAALTVVGSRDVSGIAGLLLHSVSRRLAARTSGPLLVVRGADTRPVSRRHRAGTLLLELEGDADADAALFAFEEAQLRGARLDIVRARTHRRAPLDVALIAATAEAEMVVIGTHPSRGRSGPEPDPVAVALLRRAHCPVAIVPAPAGAGRARG